MIFTEKSAVKFIVTNLSDQNIIAQGKAIAAAQQYQKVTGCSMKDCQFAASIAKQLFA
jgi:hypothetical protein